MAQRTNPPPQTAHSDLMPTLATLCQAVLAEPAPASILALLDQLDETAT